MIQVTPLSSAHSEKLKMLANYYFISMHSILLTYFKFMQGLATMDFIDIAH